MFNMFKSFDEEDYFIDFFKKAKQPTPEQTKEFLDKVKNGDEEQGLTRTAIPRREWIHYRHIQSFRKKHLKGYREAWSKAKPIIAREYAKSRGIEITKSFSDEPNPNIDEGFDSMFDGFRTDMERQASLSFKDGIQAGNSYFEEMFKVSGLDNKQSEILLSQYEDSFQVKSRDLFETQLLNTLDEKEDITASDILGILDGFDRFMLAYAGIAAGIAYDIFANSIDALNLDLSRFADILSRSGEKAFAVQWVLGEVQTEHSPDCLLMSQGDFTANGVGVWDVNELTDSNIIPGSSELDCGGNCHCHLRPIAFDSNRIQDNVFVESFTSPFQLLDFFQVTPNVDPDELKSLFANKKWIIPASIQESLSKNPFLRRSEFWDKIPESDQEVLEAGVKFTYVKSTTDGWVIRGNTDIVGRGIKTKPGKIEVEVEYPKSLKLVKGDIPLDSFPPEVLKRINEITAHELSHTFLFSVPDFALKRTGGKQLLSTIFDDAALRRIKKVAQQEYDFHLAKVNEQIKKNLNNLKKDSIPKELISDVRWLEEIINLDPDLDIGVVLRDLYKRAREGKKISLNIDGEDLRVDPSQVLEGMTAVLRKMGIGDDLVSFYQLYDVDEFLAEHMSLVLTDPSRARLLNERLEKIISKEFGKFGDTTISTGADLRVPDQISINQLQDVPAIQSLTVIPPNAKFQDIIGKNQVISTTRGVTNENARRQTREVFNSFPGLLRSEFFDKGTDINFVSKSQMKKRTGTVKDVAVLDQDTGTLIINFDKWQSLSKKQRGEMIAEVAADNLYKKMGSGGKALVRDGFTRAVSDVLSFVEAKAGRQGFKKSVVTDFRNLVLGDDGTGVLDSTHDLNLWKELFKSDISPILKKMTDLPVSSIDGLLDPESFFRDFVRAYIVNPQTSTQYGPGLYDVLVGALE